MIFVNRIVFQRTRACVFHFNFTIILAIGRVIAKKKIIIFCILRFFFFPFVSYFLAGNVLMYTEIKESSASKYCQKRNLANIPNIDK